MALINDQVWVIVEKKTKQYVTYDPVTDKFRIIGKGQYLRIWDVHEDLKVLETDYRRHNLHFYGFRAIRRPLIVLPIKEVRLSLKESVMRILFLVFLRIQTSIKNLSRMYT